MTPGVYMQCTADIAYSSCEQDRSFISLHGLAVWCNVASQVLEPDCRIYLLYLGSTWSVRWCFSAVFLGVRLMPVAFLGSNSCAIAPAYLLALFGVLVLATLQQVQAGWVVSCVPGTSCPALGRFAGWYPVGSACGLV